MVERIRGWKGQAIRAKWLRWHPLCAMCEPLGRVTVATEVDHRVPLFKGGADDDSNRQSLCTECHIEKTRADKGHDAKVGKGCDASGWPTGRGHSWGQR